MNRLLSHLQNATIQELNHGYRYLTEIGKYRCLICGSDFERGVVYEDNGRLLEAERAVQEHVEESHGGAFTSILSLGRAHTGISDVQRDVLLHSFRGLSDSEIAREMGGKSVSTVRNHRFQLRKRAKEAKILLALMELLDTSGAVNQKFLEFHGELPVQDERTMVTLDEAEAILEKAFQGNDSMVLKVFPKKQKAKLVVLNRIVEMFEIGRQYTEKEVNRLLVLVYEDYVTIRRYLVEYRFLNRTGNGSAYWRLGS